MIQSILIFSLKSIICSTVFTAYYTLVLKNVQMNSFNRIYLLSAALLSILLPFARFELFHISAVPIHDIPLLAVNGKGAEEAFTNTATTNLFNWQEALAVIYFTVATIMILKLTLKSWEVYRLKKKGVQLSSEGFLLIKTDDPRAPFSFMNMLFWPANMPQDSTESQSILIHELAHIKQQHTLDKIFMELIFALSWLNPFNWLIKKELWLQHEFLADKSAIKNGDAATFAKMLLYSIANTNDRSIISPFFQSPIKRRLLMLTQPAKNTYGLLRRFLSVPVLLTTIVLLSASTKATTKVTPSAKKIVVVLDAAHGGTDAGGKSIYGYQEKDFTLAICNKLVALSSEYNIEMITTRNEDVNASLQDRIQTSNNTDAALFLSIHVNKSTATDRRSNSYELGINPKSNNYSQSMLLASAIGDKLKTQQLPVKVVDHSKVYVIRENNHPALLMECGNLDDADNIALLNDKARTETLCRNILSGIVNYNTHLADK